MMLSKTTWYAVFVVLCFIISESDGEINVMDCRTDVQFLETAKKCKDMYVPVLITKNEFSETFDKPIISYLTTSKWEPLIRVYIDNDQCPETKAYFGTNNKCPTFYLVKHDYLLNGVWFPAIGMDIHKYIILAITSIAKKKNRDSKPVTMAIAERIEKRDRQLAEVATKTIISESDGEINVMDCHTDEQFLEAAKKCKNMYFPVLITKNEFSETFDKPIIRFLTTKNWGPLIRVYGDNYQCPETKEYFVTNNKCPSFYLVKNDYLLNGVWFPAVGMDIHKYISLAINHIANKNNRDSKPVTIAIAERIEKRNRQQAEVAVKTAAMRFWTTTEYNTTAAAPNYGSVQDSAVGSSGTSRNKRKPSPPQAQTVQRPRTSGQLTNLQTPEQAAEIKRQDLIKWAKELTLKNRSPSPPLP